MPAGRETQTTPAYPAWRDLFQDLGQKGQCFSNGNLSLSKIQPICIISACLACSVVSEEFGKISTIFTLKFAIKKAGPYLTLPYNYLILLLNLRQPAKLRRTYLARMPQSSRTKIGKTTSKPSRFSYPIAGPSSSAAPRGLHGSRSAKISGWTPGEPPP